MIEVKNLKKTYNVKGVETRALDDVSIKFPEKGMVFLLGKSGSGKSTLLNVIGGLDKADSGEIIIKGKSSSTFSNSDFDSYRNAFVGFIFQEYNILNEFTVEDNIALALELQGQKKDKEKINSLLKQVDLEGFARRKPNTLSGGQKQRIAIARALIKNPEIIMADEPTGALDSNTGKQVFDTLKKLSQEKLIIVVSHDRDFAEIYGDRIIELSDGKILTDMSKVHVDPKEVDGNINIINENVLSIKDVDELKRDDLDKIYDLLKSKKGEVIITSSEKNVTTFKQALHISDDNKSEVFNDTTNVDVKEYDPKNTKFIKSHLPFKKAFKIGASSLKSKPIRMIFTILLTVVALIMFGVTSTLMLYDESYSVKEALKESDNDYEQITKSYKYEQIYHNYNLEDDTDEITSNYVSYNNTQFSESDISYLNSKSNNKYAGVIRFGNFYGNYIVQFNSLSANDKYYKYRGVTGLVDSGSSFLAANGFNIVAGTYPTKPTEIAISKYLYDTFAANNNDIKSYTDVIDKDYEVNIATRNNSISTTLKITAIIDCGNVPNAFEEIKNNNSSLGAKALKDLTERYENYIASSFHALGYVSEDFYEYYKSKYNFYKNSNKYVNSVYARGINYGRDKYVLEWDVSPDNGSSYFGTKIVTKLIDSFKFYDLDGNKISFTAPKGTECYISKRDYDEYLDEIEARKFNKVNTVLDYYNYIPETSDLTKEQRDTYRNLINNRKFNDDEKAELLELLTYYDKVNKIYLLKDRYHWAWNEQLSKENKNYYEDPVYNEKYEKVQEAASTIDNEISNKTYNYDEAFSTLEEIYQSDELINRYFIYEAARNLYYNTKLMKDANTLEEIINKDDSTLTLDDYNTLKNILDENNYSYNTYGNITDYNDSKVKLEYYYKTSTNKSGKFTIIGVYDNGESYGGALILDDDFINANATIENTNYWYTEYKTNYQEDENAKYDSLIVKTDYTEDDIKLMLSDFGDYKYSMTNSTYQTLSIFINMINQLKKIFLIIGLVVAVFAALMLFNFISSSIASKTKEIGILRAVGARGTDLFKIFFCESGLIALICVIIAIIGSIITCNSLNQSLAENINLVLLKFGIINIGLIFAGALAITLIGTFIPVLIASKKQPVESIRTL